MNNRTRQQKIAIRKANPWIDLNYSRKMRLKTHTYFMKKYNRLFSKIKLSADDYPSDMIVDGELVFIAVQN